MQLCHSATLSSPSYLAPPPLLTGDMLLPVPLSTRPALGLQAEAGHTLPTTTL